jgi:FixJ family two-component response regulator
MTPTVFVLDDDASVRESVHALATSAGLAAEVYGSPDEFLAAYEPGRPGCLVLDLRLGEANGFDVQAELTRRRGTLPVIMVTAYGDVPAAVRALQGGALDFLEKPYAPEQLLRRIHQALEVDQRARASAEPIPDARPGTAVLRREGDFWTLCYDGALCRLRDGKGLRYLAELLGEPGREFAAIDLLARVDPRAAALRTAPDGAGPGPLLDAHAKAAYRSRMEDLRGELEEAERFNDPGRAARARDELESLARQLASAVGLGGRDRPTGSRRERVRLMVTKRVKATIGAIGRLHPALGHHLAVSVKTGHFCAYDPARPVSVSCER